MSFDENILERQKAFSIFCLKIIAEIPKKIAKKTVHGVISTYQASKAAVEKQYSVKRFRGNVLEETHINLPKFWTFNIHIFAIDGSKHTTLVLNKLYI